MRTIANMMMINAATSATTSSAFVNNSCDVLGLQVTGTFTSATVYVQGIVNADSNTWVNLAVLDLNSFGLTENGITAKGVYEAGIEGVLQVRINVSAVSGGNVSVYCKFGDSSAS